MNKLGLALLLTVLGLAPAQAQTVFSMPPPAGIVVGGLQVVTSCGGASLTNGNLATAVMDITGRLCVAATISGGISITFPTIGAAVPATGVYNGINVSGTLRGLTGLSTGSIFPATVAIVDASGNQITTFGGAATTSNATSGVATSSTNAATVAWLYGFNGTTWDQIKTKAASVAAVATDTSVVTQLNPLSPGIIALGGAVPASSVPVVAAGFTFGNMTTSTTTTFKSGAGVLHTITIGTLGTVASSVSIFDNTAGSGTSIGILNSLTTGEGTYTFDVAFSTGLTITTTGTVAPNITVSYR